MCLISFFCLVICNHQTRNPADSKGYHLTSITTGLFRTYYLFPTYDQSLIEVLFPFQRVENVSFFCFIQTCPLIHSTAFPLDSRSFHRVVFTAGFIRYFIPFVHSHLPSLVFHANVLCTPTYHLLNKSRICPTLEYRGRL